MIFLCAVAVAGVLGIPIWKKKSHSHQLFPRGLDDLGSEINLKKVQAPPTVLQLVDPG